MWLDIPVQGKEGGWKYKYPTQAPSRWNERPVCCLCGLEQLFADLDLGSGLGLEGWP